MRDTRQVALVLLCTLQVVVGWQPLQPQRRGAWRSIRSNGHVPVVLTARGVGAATDTESMDFPPPLSPLQRWQRAATFWATAGPIVARYYRLLLRLQWQSFLGHASETDGDTETAWKALHATSAAELAATITHLKGFYVKTAQIISSRHDLFPVEYTDALATFTDTLDPMPISLVRAVIQSELLHAHEQMDDVFAELDDIPLGAASVAQVHRAVLTERYGRRVVAVKVQRPSIEAKLLGDIANLKAVAKLVRDSPALPLDYYTVFAELEQQLRDEFDFVAEAAAMDRIYQSLACAPDGTRRELPLVIPRPVPGLVSRRVLVQDYIEGIPLSRARDEMMRRGVDPDGPEAKLVGRNLLQSLTTVFGRTILETGFFHADPHPGNILVTKDGVALIDFGQVKQISGRNRETLCKVMIALDEREPGKLDDMELVGQLSLELGVKLNADAKAEAAAAIGIWLFDGSVTELPGGYDMGELSPNSPVRELKSFPQDLVLVGRSTILIKGLSSRLGIPWSLAKEWAPIARQVLQHNTASAAPNPSDRVNRVRFRQVLGTLRLWSVGRFTNVVQGLPSPIRTRVASVIYKLEQQRNKKRISKK